MQRSDRTHILTTHVGSLPYNDGGFIQEGESPEAVAAAVADVILRQRAAGLDIINEGEFTKGGDWLAYIDGRFTGFEARPPSGGKPVFLQGRDREAFAAFYQYATERGLLFFQAPNQTYKQRPYWVATGPISYCAGHALRGELAVFRKALGTGQEGFITSTAPASLEPYRRNEYYKSAEEFLYALGEVMRAEYKAIIDAGFILQVDDAWLPAMWDRIGIDMGLPAFRKWCELRIEALNHALRDLPEDRIRYHLCWGSWHGPHAYDIELKQIVDLMLKVKAQAYLIEAANARHEHEYAVWDDVRLPEGKILIPGVVAHATTGVEHPELVAQRIRRFVKRLGAENVIAGTDCGLGGRLHPQIVWAKLKSLAEGARLAAAAA